MADKLNRIDRLAIRSSVSGAPLNAKQKNKWLEQQNVTFTNSDNGVYTFGEKEYNSFDGVVNEVYKDNPNFERVKTRAENYENFASTMNNLPKGLGSTVGGGLAALGSEFSKYDEGFSEEQKASQQAIRSALESIPVYGQIISAATGLVDGIGAVTGLNLSNIDKGAAERAGAGESATFNNIMNSLPGNSMLWGWMGSRTNDFVKSDRISNLGGAYSGTMMDIDAADNLAGKRVLFGKKKINNYISEAKINQDKMIAINDINSTRLKGVTSETISDYNNQRNRRYQGSVQYAVGKQGMKLMSIDEVNRILNLRKESSVQEFKNGGVIGIDSSIIPEGKLHAHKHNLQEANPDLEDVTKKGIPIVTLDEGGELQQVAEIEKEEIIFRKEITTKLEELYKDGSDEAMIEAGKLITEELMTNTDDKTEEFINE